MLSYHHLLIQKKMYSVRKSLENICQILEHYDLLQTDLHKDIDEICQQIQILVEPDFCRAPSPPWGIGDSVYAYKNGNEMQGRDKYQTPDKIDISQSKRILFESFEELNTVIDMGVASEPQMRKHPEREHRLRYKLYKICTQIEIIIDFNSLNTFDVNNLKNSKYAKPSDYLVEDLSDEDENVNNKSNMTCKESNITCKEFIMSIVVGAVISAFFILCFYIDNKI